MIIFLLLKLNEQNTGNGNCKENGHDTRYVLKNITLNVKIPHLTFYILMHIKPRKFTYQKKS